MRYEQGTITVDDDFARFGSKSYAINKINSVEVRIEEPHGRGAVWLWGILAGFTLTGAAVNSSLLAFIIGLGLAALAWRAHGRSKLRLYQLFVMTSSSENQAFQSHDQVEVTTLRDAIEGAMARR